MLAGSSPSLSAAISKDPIGALATLLPTWFLVIFVLVAVLGLVGGAVLDIYSSGLALLSLGLKVQRYVAALIDGTIMVAGAIAVVFFAKGTFFNQFQGFLITLGVPVAAWAGVMLADITCSVGRTTPSPSCSTRRVDTATCSGCRSRWSWWEPSWAGGSSPTPTPAG